MMTILVSGVASEAYTYGLADAVRVVRVDFVNGKVTVLALPRDLWVQIPSIADHGITAGKLNQAYFYGTPGMGYYGKNSGGSGLLAETLQANYGLRVDHYLAVNLNSFERFIDAIGGIDVYLPQDVYRKRFGEPELFLKAGSHHLDGREAELLARSRIEIGDFGRINNQTIILKAVAAKLLTAQGIQSIPKLAEQWRDNVLTDLSPSVGQKLACLAGKMDLGQDVNFVSLPQDLLEEGLVYDKARGQNTYALQGDPEEIGQLLRDFQAGSWPE
jgi:LCP family protein required for cell wall assembly